MRILLEFLGSALSLLPAASLSASDALVLETIAFRAARLTAYFAVSFRRFSFVAIFACVAMRTPVRAGKSKPATPVAQPPNTLSPERAGIRRILPGSRRGMRVGCTNSVDQA